MSPIQFVTDWAYVRRVIEENSKELPRSSLALSMLQYLKAAHNADGQIRAGVMEGQGRPLAAVVGWADDHRWSLIDRPAFLEFTSSGRSPENHAEGIKPLVRFLRSQILGPESGTLSFLEDGKNSAALMRELMTSSVSHSVLFEGTVSLETPIDQIIQQFRSGHRQSVDKGKKALSEWQIFGVDIEPDIFDTFRQLHKKAAGRVTRNNKSWEEMYKALKDSRAFLTVVSLRSEVIGCSYFWVSRDYATYGSAAYNRDLFDRIPISHFTLFVSMEHLKRIGIKKLYLGEIFTPQGTPKEKSIAAFKRGFTKTTELVHTVQITT